MTPRLYADPKNTTKDVLELAREALSVVMEVLDDDDYPHTLSIVAHALAVLDTELERWVIPQTSPFGRRITPRA